MSRIGNKPVDVPKGVKVEHANGIVKVTGPLGTMQLAYDPCLTVKVEDGKSVIVTNPQPEVRRNKELHGTTRALIANMMVGVTTGYQKKMEIYGTGYSVKEQGGKLVLTVGFAHVVELPIPKGVKVTIEVAATRGNEVPAKFSLSGIDKCLVAQFASDIRKVKPPEPYKGKGIRYADEHLRRKVGKAFASGGA
ncbi:MAG: 50S ribosomal protein L6 [Phycisphaerae bacterium]|nr:50S ribosomal protein L6 [Phycisphaerae bacterium]HON91454.1 50S ribosomal protein L6 [Sedimentisphaerales bacterium]